MDKKLAIMLVEDNPQFRDVIANALNDKPDLNVVSQFGTVERALSSLQLPASGEIPDVVLLDLNLPGMDGLNGIVPLQNLAPEIKIIVLTQFNRQDYVLRAISLGAAGYLLKSARLNLIADGIRTVADGGSLLDSNIVNTMVQTLKDLLPENAPNVILTDREKQVLRLLAGGHERKSVASQLEITNDTVSTHIKHIFQKLHVQNAPAAVAKAYQLGVFPIKQKD